MGRALARAIRARVAARTARGREANRGGAVAEGKWGVNTNELMALLRAKYSAPAYAFLTNVANGTGMNQAGFCDAVAMGLYPSSGLDLIGFELKISRSDWLRELKKPQKSRRFIHNFDQWYLVVSDPEIVKKGELPDSWGLLVPDKWSALRIRHRAAQLNPKPTSREFLAALLRRVNEQVVINEVEIESYEQLPMGEWERDAN